MGCGARVGPAETVMVRQYGFPSCQGSAPSSAPASTGFVPPAANRQVGLLKAVAAKPPMSNSPSSGETQPYMLMCLNSPGGDLNVMLQLDVHSLCYTVKTQASMQGSFGSF